MRYQVPIVAAATRRREGPQLGMQAVAVISISSSRAFSEATVTVVRAGLLVGKSPELGKHGIDLPPESTRCMRFPGVSRG